MREKGHLVPQSGAVHFLQSHEAPQHAGIVGEDFRQFGHDLLLFLHEVVELRRHNRRPPRQFFAGVELIGRFLGAEHGLRVLQENLVHLLQLLHGVGQLVVPLDRLVGLGQVGQHFSGLLEVEGGLGQIVPVLPGLGRFEGDLAQLLPRRGNVGVANVGNLEADESIGGAGAVSLQIHHRPVSLPDLFLALFQRPGLLHAQAVFGLGGDEVGLGQVVGLAEQLVQELQGRVNGHFLFLAHLALEGAAHSSTTMRMGWALDVWPAATSKVRLLIELGGGL